jgi:hypothetical protein
VIIEKRGGSLSGRQDRSGDIKQNRSMDLDEGEGSEGSGRERVFPKKSKGGKSGMKARWNASRTPGEESNVM